MTRKARYVMVVLATAVGTLIATPSEAQGCYADISTYSDTAIDSYDGSGNAELWYWGDVIDTSWCEGVEFYHSYSPSLSVKRISTQEIIASILDFLGSIFVAPGEYQVDFGVEVWCSLGGWLGNYYATSQRNVPPQQCPVPAQFHQTQGYDAGNAVLTFEYQWASTTGHHSTLTSCEVGEHVTYPQTPWPPPFPAINPMNPHIEWLPGTDGAMFDDHTAEGNFRPPYFETTFTATQSYRYRCTCANGNQPVIVMGPHPITRRINWKSPNNTWWYDILKTAIFAEKQLQ